jgi:hypothetical protein
LFYIESHFTVHSEELKAVEQALTALSEVVWITLDFQSVLLFLILWTSVLQSGVLKESHQTAGRIY